MDAFFAIMLTAIILRKWRRPKSVRSNTVNKGRDRKRTKGKQNKEAKAARIDDEEKRNQAEELIAVIIPTIKND